MSVTAAAVSGFVGLLLTVSGTEYLNFTTKAKRVTFTLKVYKYDV